MKTKEERKERRKELVKRIKDRGRVLLEEITRPPDEETVEAAITFGVALLAGARDGYTEEEWEELTELWENLKEERADDR